MDPQHNKHKMRSSLPTRPTMFLPLKQILTLAKLPSLLETWQCGGPIDIFTSSSWLVAEVSPPRRLRLRPLHPHPHLHHPHLHLHRRHRHLLHHLQLFFHHHLLQDHPLDHHHPLLHLQRNLHRHRHHPDHLHHRHRHHLHHPLFHCHLCFPDQGFPFCEVQRKETLERREGK